ALNKELYVFSDMQKSGWEQPAAAATLRDLSRKAAVYLVRCGKTMPRNAAVADIVPQAGVPRPGERVGFAVLVRNTGTQPLRDLKVTLQPDRPPTDRDDDPPPRSAPARGGVRPSPPPAPGARRPAPLTALCPKAGLPTPPPPVAADALAADNRLDRIVEVRDRVRVLVVDGAPNEQEPE